MTKFRWSLPLICAFILGCATTTKNANVNDKTRLNPDDGVVAVKVINNAERISSRFERWTGVMAIRIDNFEALKQAALVKAKTRKSRKPIDEKNVNWNPDIYEMQPVAVGSLGSQVFIGNMPAGQYMLYRLNAFYSDGSITAWINMPLGSATGIYEVKAGHLSNLGSLVFQPLRSIRQDNFWSSASNEKAYVTRSSKKQIMRPFIASEYPALAQQITEPTDITWKPDPLNDFRTQLANLSRQNAYITGAALLDSKGTPIIYGKLGQLRVKQAQGWQSIDLPTDSQVGSVAYDKNYTVVATEQGEIYSQKNGQSQWVFSQSVPANEAVAWVGYSADTFYAMTYSKSRVNIYSFKEPDKAWTNIGVFTSKQDNAFAVFGKPFMITTPKGVKLFNDIHSYDYTNETGQWVSGKAKGFIRLSQLDNGQVLALGSSNWDGIGDTYYSANYGESWEVVNRTSGGFLSVDRFETGLPVLMKDKMIIVSRVRAGKESTLNLVSKPLSGIADKTVWTKHGLVLSGCEVLLPEISTAVRIYAACEQGKLVSTDDLGEHWKTEIDIDTVKMQTQFEQFIEQLKKEAATKK